MNGMVACGKNFRLKWLRTGTLFHAANKTVPIGAGSANTRFRAL
jgi:hypothetical protein